MNLTIDQKMEYIRKALELGAHININFHHVDNETEALKIAHSFSKLADTPFEEVNSGAFNWFKINGQLQTTVFFDKEYMDEDVKFWEDGVESA